MNELDACRHNLMNVFCDAGKKEANSAVDFH